MKYDKEHDEIILDKGGEVAYIRIGNTVVDVKHGYPNSGDPEPVAIITIYPYENKKGIRYMVSDNKVIRLNHYNGKTDVVCV